MSFTFVTKRRKTIVVAAALFQITSGGAFAEGDLGIFQLLNRIAMAERCHISMGPNGERWLRSLLAEFPSGYIEAGLESAKDDVAKIPVNAALVGRCWELRSLYHQSGLLD